jgi:hypothetical protein
MDPSIIAPDEYLGCLLRDNALGSGGDRIMIGTTIDIWLFWYTRNLPGEMTYGSLALN